MVARVGRLEQSQASLQPPLYWSSLSWLPMALYLHCVGVYSTLSKLRNCPSALFAQNLVLSKFIETPSELHLTCNFVPVPEAAAQLLTESFCYITQSLLLFFLSLLPHCHVPLGKRAQWYSQSNCNSSELN